jgi:hypothetical protein
MGGACGTNGGEQEQIIIILWTNGYFLIKSCAIKKLYSNDINYFNMETKLSFFALFSGEIPMSHWPCHGTLFQMQDSFPIYLHWANMYSTSLQSTLLPEFKWTNFWYVKGGMLCDYFL